MGFILLLLTTGSFLIYALNNFLNPNPSASSSLPTASIPLIQENNQIIIEEFQIPEEPVCIVGAGISGLNLANILQTKGYKVIVFEKKSQVGGKAVTFRIRDEVQVDLGPLLISPHDDSVIRKIREFGVTLVAFNVSDRQRFDPHVGEIYPTASLTVEQMTLFVNAVRSYILHLSGYTRDLEKGYLNTAPDLFVSIWDWLSARNLQILRPIFNLLVTVEGYGALEEVPAIYALNLVKKGLITDLAFNNNGTLFTLQEGMDVFFNRMASSLNVQLNSDVFHISREEGNLSVFYTVTGSQLRTYNATKCHRVVLAFPPLLKNVKSIVSDLSVEEKRVLEQIKIHKYSSAATSIPNLDNSLYFQDDSQPNRFKIPMGMGEVVAFVRQSLLKTKSIYSCYSWIRGDYNNTFTKTERDNVNRRIKSTVRLMSKGGKILHQAEPRNYFPHVNTNSLLGGFYSKFDAIQSIKGLHYATTLLTLETLDNAIKMTEYISQKYF